MLYYIQILRGLSAVLVMLFHYRVYLDGAYSEANIGTKLWGHGYLGVDIFFILSGFIIVYSTRKAEHAKPVDFIIRRGLRVVPLGWLATLSFFFLEGSVHSTSVLFKSLAFVPLDNSNPPFLGYSLYGIIWSLSYELYFYLVFCWALTLTHRFRTAVAAGAIGVGLFFFQYILTGAFSWDPHQEPTAGFSLNFFPIQIFTLIGNPISLNFIVGMFLGEIYDDLHSACSKIRNIWPRLASLALFAVFTCYYCGEVGSGHGIVNKGIGASCLVLGCLLLEASAQGRKPKAGVWFFLGSISYPLYLVHNGITDRVVKKIPAVHALLQSNRGWPLLLSYIAVSIALAYCAHRVIEVPLQNAARRITTRLAEMRRRSPSGADKTPSVFDGTRGLRWAMTFAAILFALTVGLGVAGMRQVQSTNLFPQNPSFEEGLDGWPQSTAKLFEISPTTFHTGGRSAHIETLGMQFVHSERFVPQKGSQLRVDIWVYVKHGAIRVMLLEGEGRKPVGETHDYSTKEWTHMTFVTAGPLSGDFLTLHVDDFHEPSDFYIDDILIRPQW